MTEINCPVCNRVNNSKDERCWYCQALLQNSDKGQAGTDHPAAASEPPRGNGVGSGADQALPAEEIPEWLARIRARKLADQEGIPVQKKPSVPVIPGEAPGWLKEMSGGDLPDVIPPSEKEEETPQVAIPTGPVEPELEPLEGQEIEWLQDLGADKLDTNIEDDTAVETGRQPEQAVDHSELTGLESGQLPGQSLEDDAVSSTRQEIMAEPDFLDIKPEPDLEAEILPENLWTPYVPEAESGQPESVDVPEERGEIPPLEEHAEPAAMPEMLEGTPGQHSNWLPDQTAFDQIEDSSFQNDHPFEGDEKPLELIEDVPADLAALSDTWIETPGILDGINGVLQGGKVASHNGRRRDYSGGLTPTQRQLTQAALFTEILKGGKVAKGSRVKSTPLSTGMKVIKAILMLVLISSVVLPRFLAPVPAKPPILFPAELVSTISEIQNLPLDRPVLLVTNFEAGLTGEITLAVNPVIEHLVSRNIPLALLSTNAVGSAALPDFVSRVAGRNTSYQPENRILDFGYLPGGVIAFHSLVSDLRTTLPFTSELDPAWAHPIMQGINQLSDFGAVILVSDDAEVTRSWIEQVSPRLNTTPLLLVLSAQAAPMVQPYFSSGQVTGFVAGETQAVAYENLRGSIGNATTLFGGYQPVLLLTAIAIFIGGITSLVTISTPQKRKEDKSDAAE